MDTSTIKSYLNNQIDESPEAGPLLTQLMSAGYKNGFHPYDLWEAILEIFEQPKMQKQWADWHSIDEREEVRLRLKVLHSVTSLDKSLLPFIQFFFRASDPALYQLSAMIMGHQMEEHPSFKDFLERFAQKKELPLNEPLYLNGQRSRRRVILVAAAYYRQQRQQQKSYSFSLPKGTEAEKTYSEADMSVAFAVYSMILEKDPASYQEDAVKLLKKYFERSTTILNRNLLQNVGELLSKLQAAEYKVNGIYQTIGEHILTQYKEANTVASQLQSLLLVDELIKIAAQLGLNNKLKDPYVEEDTKLQFFKNVRYIHWSNRYKLKPPKFNPPGDGPKNSVLATVPDPNLPLNSNERFNFYTHEVRTLANEPEWRSSPADERAFRAFYLIDESIHTAFFDKEERYLFFKSCGLIKVEEAKAEEQMLSRSALIPVMKKLIELEPSLSRQLSDIRLIHRLSHPNMLPILLPTKRNVAFLTVLADAVEHQLRFCTATDPDFNPFYFLYILTIRKPPLSFYKHLRELCEDREYTNQEGEVLPLWEEIKNMETHINQVQPEISGNVEIPEIAYRSAFQSSLQLLRKELHQIVMENDPIIALQQLTDQLRDSGTDQVRSKMTLHDVLELVQPAHALAYRSGAVPFANGTIKEILLKVTQLADQIDKKIPLIQPTTLQYDSDVSDAIETLMAHLQEVQDIMAPVLGVIESQLLEQSVKSVRKLLEVWEKRWSEISLSWSQQSGNATSGRAELFNTVLKLENSAVCLKMLNLLWTSELQKLKENHEEDEWEVRFNLLLWGAEQLQSLPDFKKAKEKWLQLLEEEWLALMEQAKLENGVYRVTQLITNKALSLIREQSKIQHSLAEVKSWCFNRYGFYQAWQCNDQLRNNNSMALTFFQTLGEYGGYFAKVWLALLVGVILIFDFGEPWFELAEKGDVGGVIFTFSFGLIGTFLYIWTDIRKKTKTISKDALSWWEAIGRIILFLSITFIYTLGVVCLFWYMFSGTNQVVHGKNTPLYLLSWTGFALFVGVFLGLIGKEN